MRNTFLIRASAVVSVAALPFAASAHIVAGHGFLSGLIHPLLGLDHMLAMLAVGVLSTMLGIKIWKLPALFVGGMILGGISGINHVALIGVEQLIALSVLVLGALVARSKKIPETAAVSAVVFFGFMHGYAHGAEMPIVAQPTLFALGFIISTAILHIVGVLVGKSASRSAFAHQLVRLSGAAMALVGVFFLLGA